MKKILAVFLVISVSFGLGACRAFNDETVYQIAEENPQTRTVFVQINNAATFDPSLLVELEGALHTLKVTGAANPDENPVQLTDYKLTASADHVFALDLTLANVPDQVATVTTEPWFITKVQTVFNPISLLPTFDALTYYIAFQSDYRYRTTTAAEMQTQDDGTYLYVWTDASEIAFTTRTANRPLYYILAVGVAVLSGLAVYVIAQYFYCKKRSKQI